MIICVLIIMFASACFDSYKYYRSRALFVTVQFSAIIVKDVLSFVKDVFFVLFSDYRNVCFLVYYPKLVLFWLTMAVSNVSNDIIRKYLHKILKYQREWWLAIYLVVIHYNSRESVGLPLASDLGETPSKATPAKCNDRVDTLLLVHNYYWEAVTMFVRWL